MNRAEPVLQRRCVGIEVDEHESLPHIALHVLEMHRAGIEVVVKVTTSWHTFQVAFQVIDPRMDDAFQVGTRQYAVLAEHHRAAAMLTHVPEGADALVLAFRQHH